MNLPRLRPSGRGRPTLALSLLLPVLLLDTLLRGTLYVLFHAGAFRVPDALLALGTGVLVDALVLLVAAAPLLLALAFLRLRFLERPIPRLAFSSLFLAAMVFSSAVEFAFFEEFNARYNHIALDYLLFPHEVFTNIWESYPVTWIVAGALALGTGIAWLAIRCSGPVRLEELRWGARWRGAGAAAGAALASAALLVALPASVSPDRIVGEVAQNGMVQLLRAFFTAELDYSMYYVTLPPAEARERAARVLGFPAPEREALEAPRGAFELQREIEPTLTHASPALDVVVVLEESLGSQFVGALGSEHPVTPRFDEWCRRGLLLENLVANGNRTVRGMEGVLCSFVPLPGDSITKRPGTRGVASLGAAFGEAGYDTCFLYGGFGLFDSLEPFASRNGWQEFVQQGDFPEGAFQTAWGVADEYIFDALLARQERARVEGRPLFATVLSVSNHKPYAVPPGRTKRPEGEKTRPGAVAYADWALGRWLDQARDRGLLEHTVVLLVGDHGARVYGSERIPVASYRIPALFLTPEARWAGQRITGLCSQVDLAPTLLSLAGVRCKAPFLGQDLTRAGAGPGRAFVHHNRDLGLLTDDVLVVLGLQKTLTYYRRHGRADDQLQLVDPREVTDAMRELGHDAAAVFQTADELYSTGNFTLGSTQFVAR